MRLSATWAFRTKTERILSVAYGRHSAGKDKKKAKPAAAQRSAGKPRTKQGHIGVIVIAIVVVAVLVVAFKVFPSIGERSADVLEGQQITVEIPEGSTTSQIAKILKQDGVIATEGDFIGSVKQKGVADQLKAGTYRFTGGQDTGSIVDAMVEGNAGYTLLIPEGYTVKKIANAVQDSCSIKAEDFYNLAMKAGDYVADYPFLSDAYNGSMEGFLFPDIYTVPYGATADEVIRMMLDNYTAQIASVDMSYASSKNLTAYDVLTLASMVEKESRDDSDKAKIASVFYNRLHEGMNLGSDVTTYYAVGKELTEDLTKEDLNSDSPYNTRNPNHKGLPAGPICSPGLASLNAAAHPEETDNLYFFYSSKKDKTMFYKDHASFNKAWAKLQ